MNRRSFCQAMMGAAATLPTLSPAVDMPKHRVAVIGHTGRGNYGHGLDTAWLNLPETNMVGVADADPTGLKKAITRLKLSSDQGFNDYRKMLAKTQPAFLSIGPRHPDQHAAMMQTAIEQGVKGIYVEKPFVRTPAEADAVINLAKENGTRIAVAHRNRYHPVLSVVQDLIKDGTLGKLLEIRGRGKGDRRGGGEDLWVLGSHVLNVMQFFGGDPTSCSAIMLKDGKQVMPKDIYDGGEALGMLAGNELHARYTFSNNVIGTFDSIAQDGTKNAGFGLQLIGSKGIVHFQLDQQPLAHWIPGNPFQPTKEPRPWTPISSAGIGQPESAIKHIHDVQHHLVPLRDLIAACDEQRQPICDAQQGRTTVEMICAVFASHRKGGTAVSFPLAERNHPFQGW